MRRLTIAKPEGPYCTVGDFYNDPWRPVATALITHAHADNARRGSTRYLSTEQSKETLYKRLGEIQLQTLPYGEGIVIVNVRSVQTRCHHVAKLSNPTAARRKKWENPVRGDLELVDRIDTYNRQYE
jgi:hypothetical protein